MSGGDIDMSDRVLDGTLNQEEDEEGPEPIEFEGVWWPDLIARLQALRVIQFKHDKLEAKYFKDRAALEAKFQKSCEPLYNKICNIVNADAKAKGVTNKGSKENALPDFWLRALSNNDVLHAKITEDDKGALKYLRDIKWSRTYNYMGFKLEFSFATNPFFKNPVLTKTYDIIDEDLPILRKAIGTEIEWYTGKCLTPNRPNEGTKTNDWESFFNFFSPLQVPRVIDENSAKEIQNQMEQDYEIGSTIREIISHPVSWFTNKKSALPPATSLPGNLHIRMSNLASGGPLNGEDQAVLVSAINDKMQSLDAQDSCILEVLREIQWRHDKLEEDFLVERVALKAKYEKLYESLYNQRCNIVNGVAGAGATTNNEGATCQCNSVNGVAEVDGVAFSHFKANEFRGFWSHAMLSNEVLAVEISGRDVGALAYLRDIKWSKIDDVSKGFKLEFYFNLNPYFKNYVLTKTYHMFDEDVPILEKAIGTDIEWYPHHCLTNNPIGKKHKKGSYRSGTANCTVNCKSFFKFFSTPQVLGDIDAVRNQMELDYEIGSTIRDRIIPYAVSWYSGEAWRSIDEYTDAENEEDGENEDDEEYTEDEEDYEDDEDEDDEE